MKKTTIHISLVLILFLLPIDFFNIATAQNNNLPSSSIQSPNNLGKTLNTSSIEADAMYFYSTSIGWVYGINGMIAKTTDGGADWIQQNSSTENFILKLFFINPNIGWACGYNGAFLRTTNGGTLWEPEQLGTTQNVVSVFFLNENKGWVVGDSGLLLTTQNGGTTWTPQTSGTVNGLRRIQFTDSSNGWIVGSGGCVLHSTNGGATWTSQNSTTTTILWSCSFPDSSHGFAVGGDPNVGTMVFVKTTNGGASWVSQTAFPSTLFDVGFINPDTGWVIGRSGTILKTTNGGSSWISEGNTSYWLSWGSFLNNDTSYVLCPSTSPLLFTTTNGGSSWSIRNINITNATPTPTAIRITDVPNDNGKQVFIKWTTDGSPIDLGLTSFSVYRYDQQAWTYIKDVPVLSDSVYQTVAPTLYDSTIVHGMYYSVFKVIAHTSDPSIYETIGPDSGYSVDNLPPLAPTNGTAIQLSNGTVVVRWHAASNIYGDFKEYVLYRSAQPDFVPSTVTRVAFVQDTVYMDLTTQGKRFYYKTTSMDYAGNESQPLAISTATGVELVNSQAPQTYSLAQNYPNPFNPSTQIKFSIAQSGYVSLKVFDLAGEEVVSLVSQEMTPGTYTLPFSAKNLSSGMYFYRLEAGNFLSTKKMLIIK
jgi:photosystem II stability/assembly factor-like uncharacterized protein